MGEDGWMDGWMGDGLMEGVWRLGGGWDMGGWVEGGRTDGQKVGTRMTWFSRTSENIETGLAGDCVARDQRPHEKQSQALRRGLHVKHTIFH